VTAAELAQVIADVLARRTDVTESRIDELDTERVLVTFTDGSALLVEVAEG
jgi:hypothetical protein